jgi:hypothetical protein
MKTLRIKGCQSKMGNWDLSHMKADCYRILQDVHIALAKGCIQYYVKELD